MQLPYSFKNLDVLGQKTVWIIEYSRFLKTYDFKPMKGFTQEISLDLYQVVQDKISQDNSCDYN